MTDRDPVDTAGPWTIKSVPTQTRQQVTEAARKDGVTVGQWLEKRVAEWLADGGPVYVSPVENRSDPERLRAMAELLTATTTLLTTEKRTEGTEAGKGGKVRLSSLASLASRVTKQELAAMLPPKQLAAPTADV